MNTFAVVLFEYDQRDEVAAEVAQRINDICPEPYQISKSCYLMYSTSDTYDIGQKLGLMDNYPQAIPEAKGTVFRLSEFSRGRAPHALIDWFKRAEQL